MSKRKLSKAKEYLKKHNHFYVLQINKDKIITDIINRTIVSLTIKGIKLIGNYFGINYFTD